MFMRIERRRRSVGAQLHGNRAVSQPSRLGADGPFSLRSEPSAAWTVTRGRTCRKKNGETVVATRRVGAIPARRLSLSIAPTSPSRVGYSP